MASSLMDRRIGAAETPVLPADMRATWRRSLAALALLVAWILVVYASTAMGMVRTWMHT